MRDDERDVGTAGIRVLGVPQWQGSGSASGHRLRLGCFRLTELFAGTPRVWVPVDDVAGTGGGPVRAHDLLVRNLGAVRAVGQLGGPGTVVVGGDCGVELAPIEAAIAAYGEELTVVWFDAHADLNTPDSSPSGAFHGMVLRALLGDGPPGLTPVTPLRPARVVLAGVRALDPAERRFVAAQQITHLAVERLATPEPLVEAVAATAPRAVYLHIDLDVLDPGVFPSVGCPEPGGLTWEQLRRAVRAVAARFPLIGLGLTEYEAEPADDVSALADFVRMVEPLLGTQALGDSGETS